MRTIIVPGVIQPTPIEKGKLKIISLEALHDLNIKNTRSIRTMVNRYMTFGAIAVCAVTLTILLKLCFQP